jgi:hypothetical protein
MGWDGMGWIAFLYIRYQLSAEILALGDYNLDR